MARNRKNVKGGTLGLTAEDIAQALAKLEPAAKEYRQKIGKGLYVVVKPNGAKLFRWDYVLKGVESTKARTSTRAYRGARRTISYGGFPETSVEVAVAAHKEAKEDVKAGVDPVEKRRKAESTPKTEDAETRDPFFHETAKGWHATRTGFSKTVTNRDQNMVDYLCTGYGDAKGFGHVPTKQVTYEHLRPILEASSYGNRRYLIAAVRDIVTWGRAKGHWPIDRASPVEGISASDFGPNNGGSRPAITNVSDLSELLHQIDSYETLPTTVGSPARRKLVRIGLQLLPLVFVRPGTLGEAEWDHFDLGPTSGVWTIPFAKLKMRTERSKKKVAKDDYVVPLSRQACELLMELFKITGTSKFLFPAERKSKVGHIDRHFINAALVSMGYQGEQCAHGFRSTMSTIINRERTADKRRRFDPALIEMQQDRLDASTRAIYDRDDMLPERIELMQVWADKLDMIRKGAKVLPLVA